MIGFLYAAVDTALKCFLVGDCGWDRRLTPTLRSWIKRFLDMNRSSTPPYPPKICTPAIGPPPLPAPAADAVPAKPLLPTPESVIILPPNPVSFFKRNVRLILKPRAEWCASSRCSVGRRPRPRPFPFSTRLILRLRGKSPIVTPALQIPQSLFDGFVLQLSHTPTPDSEITKVY
jgi:hypothetical protein